MSFKSQGTVVGTKGTVVPQREIASERMFAFLRKVHPVKTLEHVASDLGISVDAVAKWRTRKSLPGALTLMRMVVIYGSEFFYCVAPEMARDLNSKIDSERQSLDDLLNI